MQSSRLRIRFPFFQWLLVVACAVLLATIICGAELFSPLWFDNSASDGLRYPFLIEQFYQMFQKGVWYPRWIYRLNGGYGYPTFLMYQPGYFFLSLPFSYLFGNPVAAAKALRFCTILLSFYGVYRLAHLFGNTKNRSLQLSLFLANIWGKYLIHHSGATAIMFIIWGLYFFYLLLEKIHSSQTKYAFFGLTACSTAIIYSHPFNTILYGIIIACSSAGYILQARSRQQSYILIAHLLLGALAAATLTSPYWYTAHYFFDKVNFSPYNSDILSPLWVLLNNRQDTWVFLHQYFDTSPIFYTLPLFVMTVITCWQMRRHYEFSFLVIPYLFTLFLLTKLSIPLWENIPGMLYLQRPHRLHILVDMISVIMLCKWCGKMKKFPIADKWHAPAFYVALLSLLLWNIFTFQPIPSLASGKRHWADTTSYWEGIRQEETSSFSTQQIRNEFFPLTASIKGLPNRIRDKLPIMEGDSHLVVENVTGIPLRAYANSVRNYQGNSEVTINQFYMPGWKVEVNGVALTLDAAQKNNPASLRMDDHGRMVVTLFGAGHYDIAAYYDGPPGWQWRNALILAILAALGYGYYRLQKITPYKPI